MHVYINSQIPEDYLIIDPFCGTGAVGEAAIRCGRAYLGADVDKECVDISSTRLSKVAEDLAAGRFPDERRFTQVRDLYLLGDTIHLSTKVRGCLLWLQSCMYIIIQLLIVCF